MTGPDQPAEAEHAAHREQKPGPSVCVLLLPGMTLNRSIFPTLTAPAIAPDFSTLVLSDDGTPPPHPAGPMGPYLDRLSTFLQGHPLWHEAACRLAIGHSFGGMLLLRWMLDNSSQPAPTADGLMLVSTTARPMYRAARVKTRFGWRVPISGAIGAWNLACTTRFMKRITSSGSYNAEPVDFSSLADTSDAAVDRAGWRNTDWRAMRSYRCAMEGFDVRGQLRGLKQPAIVMHGTEDSLFPMSEAEALAGELPDARLVRIEGAGHALPLTNPGELKRECERLMTRVQKQKKT